MALSISRPSDFTQRVYGVSFSVANFFAISSETLASFIPVPSAIVVPFALGLSLRRRLDPAREELLHQLRRDRHAGAVLGRVLELLEVVQPRRLEDPVHGADEAHRALRVRVEVLARGVGRDVDHVARLPLVALLLLLRR